MSWYVIRNGPTKKGGGGRVAIVMVRDDRHGGNSADSESINAGVTSLCLQDLTSPETSHYFLGEILFGLNLMPIHTGCSGYQLRENIWHGRRGTGRDDRDDCDKCLQKRPV